MRILITSEKSNSLSELGVLLNNAGFIVDFSTSIDALTYYTDIRYYDVILINFSMVNTNTVDTVFQIINNKNRNTKLIFTANHIANKKAELSAFKDYQADDFIQNMLDNIELTKERILSKCRLGNLFDNKILVESGLKIDTKNKIVHYYGGKIDLKGRSYAVLEYLVRHKNITLKKEQILCAIWADPELVSHNVVEIAVNCIRNKLDKPLGIKTIETVNRRGYKFIY